MIIEFFDSLGWYCPGDPWKNPSKELIDFWQEQINVFGRSDVRIVSN